MAQLLLDIAPLRLQLCLGLLPLGDLVGHHSLVPDDQLLLLALQDAELLQGIFGAFVVEVFDFLGGVDVVGLDAFGMGGHLLLHC